MNTIAAKCSKSAVDKAQTHIGAVLEMLVGDEILHRNVARIKTLIRKPKTRPTDKTFLTLAEVQALLAAAPSERDYLILMVLFSCGFRPSEAFALRLEDLKDGCLHVDEVAMPREKPREEGKNENAFAGVPISPDLEQDIRFFAMRESIMAGEFLFPSEIGTATSHANWRKRKLAPIAQAAGIKKVNYQIIRRTVGTLSQKYGGPKDIQSLLRHKDIGTTLGIYQQPMAESVAKMAVDWSDAIRGKQPN